jgi:hypothetical protein
LSGCFVVATAALHFWKDHKSVIEVPVGNYAGDAASGNLLSQRHKVVLPRIDIDKWHRGTKNSKVDRVNMIIVHSMVDYQPLFDGRRREDDFKRTRKGKASPIICGFSLPGYWLDMGRWLPAYPTRIRLSEGKSKK